MNKTAEGLVAHAKAQLGLPYLYGTFGQVVTPALIAQKQKQYPKQVTIPRAAAALRSHVGKRSYDCAGLVKSYWMQETPHAPPKYAAKYDANAAMLRGDCTRRGKMSSMPDAPGLLVFIGTSHVGIYIGGGMVIEARGFDYGVVSTRLGSRPWNCWGTLGWLDDNSNTKEEAA